MEAGDGWMNKRRQRQRHNRRQRHTRRHKRRLRRKHKRKRRRKRRHKRRHKRERRRKRWCKAVLRHNLQRLEDTEKAVFFATSTSTELVSFSIGYKKQCVNGAHFSFSVFCNSDSEQFLIHMAANTLHAHHADNVGSVLCCYDGGLAFDEASLLSRKLHSSNEFAVFNTWADKFYVGCTYSDFWDRIVLMEKRL